MSEARLAVEGALTFRYLLPEPAASIHSILVLLHGWTGDENTMWIFVRQAPAHTAVLSPRGLTPADPFGYGWITSQHKLETPLENYLPAASQLLSSLDAWMKKTGLPALPIDVMGFSQGAAMAGVLATHFPERVGKTAMLAGFLPPAGNGTPAAHGLAGKRFYIAHGTRDETVPFAKAQETVAALKAAGAIVTFCPSDTTHKVSLDCTKGMQEFFDAE